MAALFTPLKPVVFQGNNRIDHHLGLELSSSVESVIDYVDIKAKLSQPCCVLIYGEPGCGRTTLLLGIANAFLANGHKNSEILGVRVRPGCSLESLWNYLSEISKDKQDKDTASLLSQSTAKLNKKYSIAQNFLSSNFKLVLIDDVYSDGGIVWSHLSQMLLKVNAAAVVVCTKKDAPSLQSTLTEQAVLPLELKGLCMDSFKKYLNSKILYSRLSEDQQWKIFSMLNGNPTALKILVNTVNEYKLLSESLECIIPSWSEDMKTEEENDSCSTLLQFTFSHLHAREKQIFDQLCQLREPLPAVKFPEEVEKLTRLGLVNKSTFGPTDDAVEVIHSVSVASCLQQSLSPAADSDVQVPFSAFDAWHSLLSEKLCQLITDAKGNAWPFVPEKWQYISNVGAEERYNIKDLITAKNAVVPHLTEQDILEECLFHALKQKKYNVVAALVFVVDRFTYWQGSSHTTLQLVDYLKANSPDTPIAPQLLIRKVRIMKNAGDLQGAEQALDDLLIQKSHVGEWIYKDKYDHQLVSAVCIQIKGDIQYNLGQWAQGAKLLIDSLILFSTLPIPDTKGISSSLSILAKCLQQMTLTEYFPLAQMYGLLALHPLLQSYYCSYEAAFRTQYTPLFYAGHKGQAAEFMLRYSQLIPDKVQRQAHLNISIEDFKDSIQAHIDLQSFKSRQEFFVFTCAVYKLGLAYQEMSTQDSIGRAQHLDGISKLLYEHYCSFPGVILLDQKITSLIAHCLEYLKLGQFIDGNVNQTEGLPLVREQVKASCSLMKSDKPNVTSEEGETKKPWKIPETDCPVSSVIDGVNIDNEEFSFASHEDVLKKRSTGRSVTDKLCETREHMAADIMSAYSGKPQPEKNASENGITVDRDCHTKDSKSVVMETVDRSVITQDLEQETVPLLFDGFLPSKVLDVQPQLQALQLDSSQRVQGAVVWRFDSTRNEWRGENTLAFVGNVLELEEGKEGAQRNAFMVEFINQDDPFAKYVAKCYKKTKNIQQYQQDVICQMTARYYATLFNQQLYQADLNVGHIQFLPVVLLQLINEDGSLSGVYNVEPYMAGEFVKLTNNLNFVRRVGPVSDLVLAFGHFSYQASNELLVIVDIQGWTPSAENQSRCTFLTDPQIHSVVYKCFGTGNLRQNGFDGFWRHMHPECNEICKKLQLVRPNAKK